MKGEDEESIIAFIIFYSRLRLSLQARNEIDPRQDDYSDREYHDSDFLASSNRKAVAKKPFLMEYIGGDGSHHALTRRYHNFPSSNKFYKRFNILNTGRLKPIYSRPYSRVASPDPVRYGRQTDGDYYSRLLRL